MCGWPAKMMVHIGGVETRELMSEILDLLRPGDVLTHAYSGAPNIAGAFTNIVQDGKLLPAALSAKQRGVMFDVGHGGGSFDFTVAEVAIAGGCGPDTISSDIHVFSGNTPGMPYLPNVMSKFIPLGYTVEQVVAMATAAPAKIINRAPKIGTLQIGAPGDVAIMDLVEAQTSFVDTRNNRREGKLLLKPVQTVINGVPFGRPYQAPFAVRYQLGGRCVLISPTMSAMTAPITRAPPASTRIVGYSPKPTQIQNGISGVSSVEISAAWPDGSRREPRKNSVRPSAT